jgi:hypothetical protein
MIVSQIFYAVQMHPGHWMRRYYTEELHSMEGIAAAIRGRRARVGADPLRQRYEGYWAAGPASGALPALRRPDPGTRENIGCL